MGGDEDLLIPVNLSKTYHPVTVFVPETLVLRVVGSWYRVVRSWYQIDQYRSKIFNNII